MKQRVRFDHGPAVERAISNPGQWTPAAVYTCLDGAQAAARRIAAALRMPSYNPAGAFEAYAALCADGAATWVRYVMGVEELGPRPTTVTYRVCDRGTSTGYEGVRIVSVTVPATCPQCGGPRGAARSHRFHEDGDWFYADMWDNACGHVDMYDAVLAEHRRLEDEARRDELRRSVVGWSDLERAALAAETRPVHVVAARRAAESADPLGFNACMVRAHAAVLRGEDVAGSVWTAVDPVKTAAEIEVLAGARRLALAAPSSLGKDAK